MDNLYTQARFAQYRGPATSDDYNKRIEENYKDLVTLLNRTRLSEIEVAEVYRRVVKSHLSLARVIQDLEQRLVALEEGDTQFNFFNENNVDNDRFDGTAFEIGSPDRLTLNARYGILTLPRIDSGSLSKLFFVRQDGEELVPSAFSVRVVPHEDSADNSGATIDESPPEHALFSRSGFVWERNVVVSDQSGNGAALDVFIKVPTNLFTTANSNMIKMHPFPIMDCDVEFVGYTTRVNPSLSEEDDYTPLNSAGLYTDSSRAKGWVPPGGWPEPFEGEDIIQDAGPRIFYFDPKPITAIKITLRQNRSYFESNNYVYTYGLSLLDLRQDKFLPQGKTILRFDAPDGATINNVLSIQPDIFNIPQGMVNDIFDYRVIWETAFESGEYTLNPVFGSQRVWVELSMFMPEKDWTPSLVGLTVDYQ